MADEKKRVLIMEDSDIFADMLMESLSSDEYTLERSINGFEGIKRVYTYLPHLIIADVEMPLFKGHQVTRFLKSRKNTATIPIIMFTTRTETKDRFWGSHAGAEMYIEKSPDNFQLLRACITKFLSAPQTIDFTSIEREGKKINDASIIEIVNSQLDNKLFQTTVIGKLTELSDKVFSLELIIRGVFDLLHTICETEIVTMMIRSVKGTLYVYTANFAGFQEETVNDFSGISVSDFSQHFPDYQVEEKHKEDFYLPGSNKKKIVSYTTIPVSIGGDKFATLHIANSINDYFSPAILDNINVFIGAAAPIITNALSMRELAELQSNTRTAFARYVPADIMDEIIDSSSKMVSQSETRNITVLFADIRNFTALSEHSSAQDTVEFLNAFFAEMGSVIFLEGGHVDKFIGDAIMAVFGAFHNLENPIAGSIRAAVKMLAALENMNTPGIILPRGSLKIGVGINYGPCVLGNIGFKNKMDYTVIGDTVNLASRLEGVSKLYRYPIIVSEYVYNAMKDQFLLRKVDNVRVKGKEEPVGIYAVYTGFEGADGNVLRSGETSDLPIVPSLTVNRQMLMNYNKGLQLFHMREWKPAQEYFTKAVEADKGDYLSQLYLNRAVEYAKTPPPEDWDGVLTLSEK